MGRPGLAENLAGPVDVGPLRDDQNIVDSLVVHQNRRQIPHDHPGPPVRGGRERRLLVVTQPADEPHLNHER
jgi:hypothetical protein